MKEDMLNPTETAIVSIDMQQSVKTHAAAPYTAPEVIGRVRQIIDAGREAGALPIYVRTSYLPDESDNLKPVLDVPRPAKIERPEGWDQIVSDLDPLPTEPIVIKRSFNAFFESDLDLQLRRRGIKTIILAGISTNFGVEGTGRGAYERGYDVVFVEDAMAAATAEGHRASVDNTLPYIGRVRTTQDVIDAFSGAAGSNE